MVIVFIIWLFLSAFALFHEYEPFLLRVVNLRSWCLWDWRSNRWSNWIARLLIRLSVCSNIFLYYLRLFLLVNRRWFFFFEFRIEEFGFRLSLRSWNNGRTGSRRSLGLWLFLSSWVRLRVRLLSRLLLFLLLFLLFLLFFLHIDLSHYIWWTLSWRVFLRCLKGNFIIFTGLNLGLNILDWGGIVNRRLNCYLLFDYSGLTLRNLISLFSMLFCVFLFLWLLLSHLDINHIERNINNLIFCFNHLSHLALDILSDWLSRSTLNLLFSNLHLYFFPFRTPRALTSTSSRSAVFKAKTLILFLCSSL